MEMLGKLLLRSIGRRNLHTKVVSTEIIKPSSPTPSHLKTHNLTTLAQIKASSAFMPLVSFYPNNTDDNFDDKTLDLKRSLSQILTKYYPFAGRHAKTASAYVDCNDEGVEFLVASIDDTTLSDFLQNFQYGVHLDRFFPHGQAWLRSDLKTQSNQMIPPLAVQINRFQCGGVAVALSLSHRVADASSCFHFTRDWAKMTQLCSGKKVNPHELPSDPIFLSQPYRNINFNPFTPDHGMIRDCVTRSFIFPNSKLNELKLKVKASMTTSLSRNDVLTWLLYKCAAEAATKNNSGIFTPTTTYSMINIRHKLMEPLPEKTIGSFVMSMAIPTNNESESIKPESFISALQKEKMKFQRLRNMEDVYGLLPKYAFETDSDEQQKKIYDDYYLFSSVHGYPAYDLDFGWGKPVKVTFSPTNVLNGFLLMDAPNGDGIEATVCLEKEVMAIFESHPKLLEFC